MKFFTFIGFVLSRTINTQVLFVFAHKTIKKGMYFIIEYARS